MYSKTQVIGRLGRSPESRFLPNGTQVTSMSVASSRKWTTASGEKKEITTWYKASAWRGLAEICNNFLDKGSKVFLEGHLDPDPETGGPKIFTRNDGSSGANYEMTVTTVVFLDSKGDKKEYQQDDPFPDVDEDDLPF